MSITDLALYDPISDEAEDTQLFDIPTIDLERRRDKRTETEANRLQRRVSGRNKRIKKEDLLNFVTRSAMQSAPDLFEDETIPGKAIVMKMPERSMKAYFIPLPIDLEVSLLSQDV